MIRDSYGRGMKEFEIDSLRQIVEDSPEVAAAYLFGSAAANEPVVNDLDILLLLYPHVDKNVVYFDLHYRITHALGLAEDLVDLLFFDLEEADPEILYEAIDKGILIKNVSPDLLGEKIEALSCYLTENEFLIKQAKKLQHERLEVFCGYRT